MLKNTEFYETLTNGISEQINKPKANFDENDPTKVGYVKNRTHWKEEIPAKNVVLCEGTVTPGAYSNIEAWPLSKHLEAGVIYNLTINGAVQSVIADTPVDVSSVAIQYADSNGNALGSFYEKNRSGKLSWSGTPGKTDNFKIEFVEPTRTIYHTLDPQYLPPDPHDTVYECVLDVDQYDEENGFTWKLSPQTPYENLKKAFENENTIVFFFEEFGWLATCENPEIYSYINFHPEYLACTINSHGINLLEDGLWAYAEPYAPGFYDMFISPNGSVELITCFVGADLKELRAVEEVIGNLADLTTTAKENLVEAINEVKASSGSLGLTSASVGQTIKVKAVDENGKPTAWETAEAAGGGGDEEEYELVFQETVASDIINYTRDKDKDGTPFSLTDAVVIVFTPPFAESTNRVGRALGCVPNTSWGHYTLISISSSTPATTDSSIVGRYDVVYVKAINGYQTVKEYYSSQGDNTNLFSVMQRVTTTGKAGFYFTSDKNKIMEIGSPQGNITCVKLVSYATAIPAGSIIACYKRKGT